MAPPPSSRTSTSSKTRSASSFLVEGCDGPYQDYLRVSTREIQSRMAAPASKRKGPRGGVCEPFPVKLYDMLVGVEQDSRTSSMDHIVSWKAHGRCFEIRDPQAFVREIMPVYFKQSKLTSFQRQLNLYGFQRVTSNKDRGCYYHALFLRGRPDICRIMLRQRVKGGAAVVLPGSSTSNTVAVTFDALPRCPPAVRATPVKTSSDEGCSDGCSDDEHRHLMTVHHHQHRTTSKRVSLDPVSTVSMTSSTASDQEDACLATHVSDHEDEADEMDDIERQERRELEKCASPRYSPEPELSYEPLELSSCYEPYEADTSAFELSPSSFGEPAYPPQPRYNSAGPDYSQPYHPQHQQQQKWYSPPSPPSMTVHHALRYGKQQQRMQDTNDIETDSLCQFEGRTFRFMDDEQLRAYESDLIGTFGSPSSPAPSSPYPRNNCGYNYTTAPSRMHSVE